MTEEKLIESAFIDPKTVEYCRAHYEVVKEKDNGVVVFKIPLPHICRLLSRRDTWFRNK